MEAASVGALSGALAGVFLQPFDVIKTRQQIAVFEAVARGDSRAVPPNALHVARQVFESGGGTALGTVRAVWKGSGATLARVAPGAAIYFSVVSSLKSYLIDHNAPGPRREHAGGQSGSKRPATPSSAVLSPPADAKMTSSTSAALPAWQVGAVGAIARATVTVTLAPLSLVKTRIEGGGSTRGVVGTLMQVVSSEGGAVALYRGVVPTLVRDCPHAALHLAAYEYFKSALGCNGTGEPAYGKLSLPIAGLSAGVLATAVTHPPDVFKSEAQFFPRRGRWTLQRYFEIVRAVWTRGGIKGLYAGIGVRLLRRGLLPAISWPLFETISATLAAGREREQQ